MRKKNKKAKYANVKQKSFYFEDFLESNKKNKSLQKDNLFQDRIYLLFFLFFSLILILSIRILHVSLNTFELHNKESVQKKFTLLRRDIVDRNGVLISRNVKSSHAAINPSFVVNKKNFLLKLRLSFPELKIEEIEKNLEKGKYFYLKKRINQN